MRCPAPGPPRGPAIAVLAALAGAGLGCGHGRIRIAPSEVPPSTAEAISFLGDTLWSVPLTIEAAQGRLARLGRARRSLAERPDDVNARLAVARQTAAMGRLREAIALLSEALDRHIDDPRLYRLRAELLLQTRRPAAALDDLAVASRLVARDSAAMEFIEIDDVGLVGFGVRHSVFLLLGQTHFVRAEHAPAARALSRALLYARNADEAAVAAVWLVLAASRSGGDRQLTASILASWRADAEVALRFAEHRLLLLWKGVLPVDSLRASVREFGDAGEEALYTFASGIARLDRAPDEARELFEVVRAIGDWTSVVYVAAEAELARLRRARPAPPAG